MIGLEDQVYISATLGRLEDRIWSRLYWRRGFSAAAIVRRMGRFSRFRRTITNLVDAIRAETAAHKRDAEAYRRLFLDAKQERDILLQWMKDYYDRLRHEKNYAVSDELRSIVKAAGYDLKVGKDGLSFYG